MGRTLRDSMDTPRVSIVLPTYNRAGLLPAAVQSCLDQTVRELELIIVDDGSMDGTLDVARKLAAGDSRVRVISQKNAGLPSALNRGFAEAQGEFWTWTSDDNRYHPDAIEVMLRELEHNPESGMVYMDYQAVDEKGCVMERIENRHLKDLAVMNVIGPCFLYRSSIAKQVGKYDPHLCLIEDWDYWLRMDQVAPIRYLPGISYDFLDHGGSLTRRKQLEVLEAELKMRKRTSHAEGGAVLRQKSVARRLSTLHWAAGNKLRALYFRMQSF